jgi:hypothetical protein
MPEIIGIDWAKPESDHTSHALIKGMTLVCVIPRELGAVTRLEVRNGKVVCHTESGIEMIVPTGKL